jgi:hypothetical protein
LRSYRGSYYEYIDFEGNCACPPPRGKYISKTKEFIMNNNSTQTMESLKKVTIEAGTLAKIRKAEYVRSGNREHITAGLNEITFVKIRFCMKSGIEEEKVDKTFRRIEQWLLKAK